MIRLRPKIHPIVARFLREKQTLMSMIQSVGAPIHAVFPQVMSENIQTLQSAFKDHSVRYRIHYAHKVNQARSLVKQAECSGIALDASSKREVISGLSNGFHSSTIEVTGPKNKDFILLCLQHNVVINVDSLSELVQIIELKKQIRTHSFQSILLRFSYSISENTSKFGLTREDIEQAFILSKRTPSIKLLGFSFHLDTNDIKERLAATEQVLQLYEHAYARGFTPSVINIGGNFRQVFIEDNGDIYSFKRALQSKEISNQSLTWNDFIVQQHTFEKFSNQRTATEYLSEFLESNLIHTEDKIISDIFRDNDIELWLEPGKCLVDHVGITIDVVTAVKKLTDTEYLVGLSLKRDDVVSSDQEILMDPIVIPIKKAKLARKPFGVYFSGSLCLEGDILFRHKVFLNHLPEEGDLVVCINTAGYGMDLSSTQALMKPRIPKLAVIENKKTFIWYMDESYNPYFHL